MGRNCISKSLLYKSGRSAPCARHLSHVHTSTLSYTLQYTLPYTLPYFHMDILNCLGLSSQPSPAAPTHQQMLLLEGKHRHARRYTHTHTCSTHVYPHQSTHTNIHASHLQAQPLSPHVRLRGPASPAVAATLQTQAYGPAQQSRCTTHTCR